MKIKDVVTEVLKKLEKTVAAARGVLSRLDAGAISAVKRLGA